MRQLNRVLRALCWGFCITCAHAQLITTLAGTTWKFPQTPLPAANAPLGEVNGVAVDTNGNLFLSDTGNNMVMRVTPDGTLTVVAGNGIAGYSGDGGPATSASLSAPYNVTLDLAGNLYIADSGNLRVRKVNSAGVITTIAGNGSSSYSGDGVPAAAAGLNNPQVIAVDRTGILYIGDAAAGVRKVNAEGIISTIVSLDQIGALAPVGGLVVDTTGTLYLSGGGSIFGGSGGVAKVTPSGVLIPIPGYHPTPGIGDTQVIGLALDTVGNVYFAEFAGNRVLKLSPGGVLTVVAGAGAQGFSGDGGPATKALLDYPYALAVGPSGKVFIADSSNFRIREVTSDGLIVTLAGNGSFQFSGDGGAAATATLGAGSLARDHAGNLYFSDGLRVRKITPAGIITTIAGNGSIGNSGDNGPAVDATFNDIVGISLDGAGNLFLGDGLNGNIRKVTPNGTVTTLANNLDVWDVASDATGNVYVTELFEHKMVRVSTSGAISTVAGNGKGGLPTSGDFGPATAAVLDQPQSLAIDGAGVVYIGDTNWANIRKVTPSGTISTLAFTDAYPFRMTTDADGNLYVSDFFNGIVQKVTPAGVVSTVAGNGPGYSGDGGPALQAALNPAGLAVDSMGNLYIASGDRIREVLATAPEVKVSTQSLTFSGASTGASSPKQNVSIASIPGLAFSLSVKTATGGDWLSVTPQSAAAPRLIDVIADPSRVLTPGTYTGTITIATPNGNPTASVVNVTFTVAGTLPPALTPLDPRNLSFSLAKSTLAQSQRLTISNSGGGTLNFAAVTSVTTPSGGKWLSVSVTSGQATPGVPATLTVTADPSGLGPGSYSGTVTVSGAGTSQQVPVTMTISSLNQVIRLSQRGLSFTGVSQGGAVPPQTFAIQNIGTGTASWTVSTSTLSGGQGWLQVTPASGSSEAVLSPSTVTVSVNAASLAAGIYYGLVQVNSPAAANSPQVVTVFLQVLPPDKDAAAVVDQGSMLFTAPTGGGSPSSQNLLVYNIAATAKSFRSVVSADPGLSVVTLPTDATLDPQHPTPVVIQPFTTGLASGVYSAALTLQFSDGRVLRVNVKVIVSRTGGITPAATAAERGTSVQPRIGGAACTPTKLLPALISLADSAEIPTGLPVKLGVYVKDDCGMPVQTGFVKATFSNQGGTATLTSLAGGLWEGQWLTQKGALSQATVKLHAENAGLTGDQQVTANLLALEQPPTFDQSGITAVFGGPAYASIAPGSVITIYGSQLAADSAATTGSPLPRSWLGTQAFISGGNDVLLRLPLYYVSPDQLNAIVPYEVQTNTPLQLLVQRGSTVSQPVEVNLAAAQPVLLGGDGAITDYPSNGGAPFSVTSTAPAHAGDTLVLYCLGLGAVSPSVTDGGLPSGLAQVSGVQVQTGSQTTAAAFAGLTSQFPGLYQVNVVVPANTGTGSAVPLTVMFAGQVSSPIAITIQ